MKSNREDFELVVEQGRRPFWMLLVAALMFTYVFYAIYEIGYFLYLYGFKLEVGVVAAKCLKGVVYCLAGGISYSVRKTVLIDVDKNILISRYNVGVFSRDVKSGAVS